MEKPPFKGEIGEKIFNQVSKEAWSMWHDDMQIKVINEYRINLADKGQYNFLIEQMLAFLNLSDSTKIAEVENAERGRGE